MTDDSQTSMENTYKKNRHRWWPWSLHRNSKSELERPDEKSSQTGLITKRLSVSEANPLKTASAKCTSKSKSKKYATMFGSRTLSKLLHRSSGIIGMTPEFRKIPHHFANSIMVSPEECGKNKTMLTVGAKKGMVSLFNDDQILYFPFQKEDVIPPDSKSDNFSIHNSENNIHLYNDPFTKTNLDNLTVRKSEAPEKIQILSGMKDTTAGEPLKSLFHTNFTFTQALKQTTKSQQLNKLWNLWVESDNSIGSYSSRQAKKKNSKHLSVKKKFYNLHQLEQMCEEYEVILELYVYDKEQNIYICPLNTKPLVGKSADKIKHKDFMYLVPYTSGKTAWTVSLHFLTLSLFRFESSILGLCWKVAKKEAAQDTGKYDNGYSLTLQTSIIEDEIAESFVREVLLTIMNACSCLEVDKRDAVALQNIFGSCSTNSSEGVLAQVNV